MGCPDFSCTLEVLPTRPMGPEPQVAEPWPPICPDMPEKQWPAAVVPGAPESGRKPVSFLQHPEQREWNILEALELGQEVAK